ncbi:MAG: PhzF family phenazine biosynthesis protein [Candidatus Krumholzibacteria bacterium]|nr:PhzF family phenazine biosynthesis protein [Candidatus Krumholzibacteria bacterium]
MQNLVMKQVDVFTAKPFSGNPAGVITEADSLSSEMMLAIANEMNLAETTFATLPSRDEALFKIRFFTPSDEIRLSGHALIASCYALIEDGRIPVEDGVTKTLFETKAGIIQVDVHFRHCNAERAGTSGGVAMAIGGKEAGVLEKIMLHQSIKQFRPSNITAQEIAKTLGIDASEILRTGLPLEIISTGLEQLMIPVARKETIREMNPDLIKLGLMNRRSGTHSNHVFAIDTYSADCTAYMRHFAPALGMWEDPASGTAAAGLASYLLRHGVVTSGNMIIEQGRDTDNLARILVEAMNAEESPGEMRIGGIAVTSITRRIGIENGELIVS